ncbi:MAG TPA: hypothetical protein EYP52_05740 [Anaerolineae bacterium]|nr:hypothetical protein [Anaerolineae bacterium]
MRELLRRWAPPLVWMGVIYVLSAQPSLPSAPEQWLDVVLKKSGHALAYGLLAWLYLQAMRREAPPSKRLRLLSLVLAVAYGVTDEVHQALVPGRTPRLTDVLIDGVGATLAIALEQRRARARPPAPR